jgi:tRNA-uridine 2-sulfurtransferase
MSKKQNPETVKEKKGESSEAKQPTLDEKSVVVGVTGRLDSAVAAYLLKKQGFKVSAIGLVFEPRNEEEDEKIDSETGEPIPKDEFVGVYLLKDLQDVKKVLDSLEIPFYAVDASTEYQDAVTDPAVSARLAGRMFSPKIYAQKIIFNVLVSKADKLGARWISTGHYAKAVQNAGTGFFNILVANDLEFDQSYLLSLLDQRILERVVFPLSEMRKVEVKKIAEMLKLHLLPEVERAGALMRNPKMGKFLEKRVAPSLYKEGLIVDYKMDLPVGDHEGLHYFYLGQRELKTKTGAPLDKELIVIDLNMRTGVVNLGRLADGGYKHVFIRDVNWLGQIDQTRPLDVYVQFTEKGEKIAANLFFKNNCFLYIEFKTQQKGFLYVGEYICFYNRKGMSGKLMGGGIVAESGFLEEGKIRSLPKRDDLIIKDEDNDNDKKDIYAFKF